MRAHNFQDLTGLRFGRWAVVEFLGTKKKRTFWKCRCDCGNEKTVIAASLKSGGTTSCGCFLSEKLRKRNTRHDYTRRHNISPTYFSWAGMKSRCLNENDPAYARYGGREIFICDRWLNSFENFLADMRDRPAGMTLERRDNNGPYSPENCYWATPKQQARNRRNNRVLTIDGEALCISAWVDRSGIAHATIARRLDRGWPAKESVFTPV